MDINNPKIYNTVEVARILKVHPNTVRKEVERDRLKCFYVGNELRFTMKHLEDYANIKDLGKTTRELELEEIIEEQKLIIKDKEESLEKIKKFILLEV